MTELVLHEMKDTKRTLCLMLSRCPSFRTKVVWYDAKYLLALHCSGVISETYIGLIQSNNHFSYANEVHTPISFTEQFLATLNRALSIVVQVTTVHSWIKCHGELKLYLTLLRRHRELITWDIFKNKIYYWLSLVITQITFFFINRWKHCFRQNLMNWHNSEHDFTILVKCPSVICVTQCF